MKPKIKLLVVAFLCSISNFLFAQSVNISTARAIAENQLRMVAKPLLKSANIKGNSIRFTSVKAAVENSDTLYYILNDTIDQNFVIVSADRRAWPILAYSTEGSFNEKKQPEAFKSWMDSKKKEIEYIKKNDLQPDSTTLTSWQKLSLSTSPSDTNSVEPLLKTKWGQGCYYNEMCPADEQSPFCGHDPTGCVATAMAQIMKYWNYPTKGKGSNWYILPQYGTISANFGATTYKWDQMPDKLTDSNNAVATLMYHCGVASYMSYAPFGSGTVLTPDVLVDYFDYSSNIKLIDSKDYTADEWADQLKSELDLGHPIYYGTTLPSGDRHALVCDGYQGNDFFHFNWGWDGTDDGYYYVNRLNATSQTYNCQQQAIVKIIPARLPDGYKGLILSSNTLKLNAKDGVSDPIQVTVASSTNWTAFSDQEWLKLNVSSGDAGNSNLSLSVSENTTNLDRTATVTVAADGFPPQTISVKQFHEYEVTAGDLENLMGDDLSSITNLTLTGNIDARDFKTMRDLMPALESIDLSGATIVEYTGDQGTAVEFQTYPANTIPKNAFAFGSNGESSRLTTFICPVSTTAISKTAFNACMSLTDLLLPPTLQSIGDHNFDNCNSLKSIYIPSSVSTIGEQLYGGISVDVDPENPNYMSQNGVLYNKEETLLIHCPTKKNGTFKIPETVNTIGYNAFGNCIHLTSIVIPSSVKTIETWAFNGCMALTSISLPSTVRSIGDGVFFGCKSLKFINVGNPVPVDLRFSADVFLVVNKDECILNVPYRTAELYRSAYQWGDFKNIIEEPGGFSLGITEINLTPADTIVSVPVKSDAKWSAASDQSWLSVSPKSASGDSILSIEAQENHAEGTRTAQVTVSAEGYESQIITVLQDGAAIKVTAGNLNSLFTDEELRTMTSLKLSGTIDARDFKTMRDLMPLLSSVDLGEVNIVAYSGTEGTSIFPGVHSYPANEIPEWAFAPDYSYGKNSLRSFIFPESVTAIEGHAFCNCSGLTSLALPGSIQYIGTCALGYCKNLTNIFIPSSVATIANQALAGSLGPINVDPVNPNFSSLDGVLYDRSETNLLQCPISKTGSFIIPETVSVIGPQAFINCTDITSLTIPASVLQIQWCAFEACTNLSKIVNYRQTPAELYSEDFPFFLVNKESCVLYVPFGSKKLYQDADVWKDFTSIVEMSYLTLSQSKVNMSANANSINVSIKSNTVWTVIPNQSWLRVAPDSGKGDLFFTLKAQKNTSPEQRTAIVTVSGRDVLPQTITINQDAGSPTGIAPESIESGLTVYPNPTKGKFKLLFGNVPPDGILVTISDISGKVCLKQLIREKETWIDLSRNKPGVYLIKTDQDNIKVQKVVLN